MTSPPESLRSLFDPTAPDFYPDGRNTRTATDTFASLPYEVRGSLDDFGGPNRLPKFYEHVKKQEKDRKDNKRLIRDMEYKEELARKIKDDEVK